MKDRSKLPKWAQDKIRQLERERDEWKAETIRPSNRSNTFIEHQGFQDLEPLGESPRLRIETPTGSVAIRLDEDGRVNVNCWHGPAIIRPIASNAFTVEVAKR